MSEFGISEYGRPRTTKEYIVDQVLTPNEIEDFNWTFLSLVPKLIENEVDFAASLGLISNSSICETCEIPRGLIKRNQLADGFQWRCSVNKCRSVNSIRAGSFLEQSRLQIKQIILILYCWSLDLKLGIIQKQVNVSTHTITDWLQFIREICEQDILNNPMMLGGVDKERNNAKEVEVDKCFFFKRKFLKGSPNEDDVWVFCAVERGSHHCNLTTVQRRDRDALFPIIRPWILPGTRIISDGWADYEGLDQFEHDVYEHEHDNEKHKILKLSGGRQGLDTCDRHLVEYMWRHREKAEVFPRIIQAIRNQYSFGVS